MTAIEIQGRNFYQDIKEKFLRLSIDGRLAVGLTIVASIIGLTFAILAPNLNIVRRIGRIGVDVFLLGGVLAFLKTGENPTPRKGFWSMFRRVTVTIAAIITLGVTLIIPNVDIWLKSYRFCLGLIILAMGLWDIGRILPKEYLKKNLPIAIIFGIVELITVTYIILTVDGPIAYAGGKAAANSIISRLEGPGLLVSDAGKVDPMLFIRKNGRYYSGPALHDFLRFVHNNPVDAVNTVVELSLPQSFKLIPGFGTRDKNVYCQTVKKVRPPLEGYMRDEDQIFAIENSIQCASNLKDKTWHNTELNHAETILKNYDKKDIAEYPRMDCTTRLLKWNEREVLDITLQTYRKDHKKRPPEKPWFKRCFRPKHLTIRTISKNYQ